MKTKGLIIHTDGDNSTGIPPQTFEMSGDFNFNSEVELEEFKSDLKELFEDYFDFPFQTSTFEEQEQWLEYQKETDRVISELEKHFRL